MASFLTLNNVVKQYGSSVVIKETNLSFEENSFHAIVGRNGCGKTTLLHIMAKILKPSSGSVTWHLQDFAEISMLGQASMFYPLLSAYENLQFFASLHQNQASETNLKKQIKTALEICSLRDSKSSVETYSKGMLQRLAIARIILTKAKYLFLDEPFNALDLNGQKLLMNILSERGISAIDWKIRSFIMIDHEIGRVAHLAEKIYFGHRGEFSAFDNSAATITKLEARLKADES